MGSPSLFMTGGLGNNGRPDEIPPNSAVWKSWPWPDRAPFDQDRGYGFKFLMRLGKSLLRLFRVSVMSNFDIFVAW